MNQPVPAPQAIDFYFDFSSPYGYFMSEKINALATQHGRVVKWRPILLFAMLRALGLPPPFEHPVKLEYITADFERSAKFLDIDYRLPAGFPVVTQHAARAFYLLNEKAPGAAVPLPRPCCCSYWREARDISDINVISQMVCDASDTLGPVAAVQ
ncbi:DsbA family protein [Polaromonas sp. P1-6]|nr:DsbA family protein [Polaromonas sp. P1-6]